MQDLNLKIDICIYVWHEDQLGTVWGKPVVGRMRKREGDGGEND
jgi:hypothetical protein